MKTRFIISSLILSTFGFFSCDDTEDNVKPTITILNPTENQVFTYGNTFNLNLKLSDEGGISQYKYELNPVSDQGIKFAAKNSFTVTTFYTDFTIAHPISIPATYNATTPYDNSEYILKVTATDYNQNTTTKELKIVINN